MSNRNIATGGAIPGAWNTKLGITFGENAEEIHAIIPRQSAFISAFAGQFIERFVDPQLRADLVAPAKKLVEWSVRDQGRRATCTAFAVAAMEELWRATDADLPDLSEEFLYDAARSKSFDDVNIHLPEGKRDALTQSGAIFLKQAMVAMQSNGICLEDEAPYNKRALANARIKPDGKAIARALGRQPDTGYVHNVVDDKNGHVVGEKRDWTTPLKDGERVSDILLSAIQNQRAVAAGFAVLNGVGRGAWFGSVPFLTGAVTYPDDSIARGLHPTGGHAVCIVGFVADQSDNPSNNSGWFAFRNSLGRHRFARDAKPNAKPPASSLPGYGLISSADVDRYCWEYLFREKT